MTSGELGEYQMVLSKTVQGGIGGEGDIQIGVGQDWVYVYVDNYSRYIGEEDEIC